MKELIYRNLYLIRKNALITFALYIGFITLSSVIALSAKFGNISKYGSEEIISGANDAAIMMAVLAGIVLCTTSDCINDIIKKDYQGGWHKYIVSSGVKKEQYVAVNYIMSILLMIVSFVFGIIGVLLARMLSGKSDLVIIENAGGNHDLLLLIVGSLVFYMYISYITLVSYLTKCTDSLETQLLKVAPAFLISVIPIVNMILSEVNAYGSEIYNTISKISKHLWMMAGGALVFFILLTFVCYLISVNTVKKEGRVL